MDSYITGAVIRRLREKSGLTQAALAEKLSVSDKTVSKWETSKGYPDISLLQPIADVFRISVTELLSGNPADNRNVSANMLRCKFYVCPVCGNIILSTGEAAVSCHGIRLLPAEAEPSDEAHMIMAEHIEDEYFVHIDHEMTKNHYISFVAAVAADGIRLVKLYPEGPASCRVQCRGVRTLYCYCKRDGLFRLDINRFIDRRDSSHSHLKEQAEPEKAAGQLFG